MLLWAFRDAEPVLVPYDAQRASACDGQRRSEGHDGCCRPCMSQIPSDVHCRNANAWDETTELVKNGDKGPKGETAGTINDDLRKCKDTIDMVTVTTHGGWHRPTTSDDAGPVEYPQLRRYTEWRVWNGRLILKADTISGFSKDGELPQTDTADIQLLMQDSLVLRFADHEQSYYRKQTE